jgi:hypothetical protein
MDVILGVQEFHTANAVLLKLGEARRLDRRADEGNRSFGREVLPISFVSCGVLKMNSYRR